MSVTESSNQVPNAIRAFGRKCRTPLLRAFLASVFLYFIFESGYARGGPFAFKLGLYVFALALLLACAAYRWGREDAAKSTSHECN